MAGKENREIKNSVFVDLFYEDESAEANEIALFNAIHDEPLPEGTKIRRFRVDNTIYMNFQNDISFDAGGKVIVFGEHQSTINENMPLRSLLYIGRAYERLVPPRSRYKKKIVPLPTPEFYTFYNGKENREIKNSVFVDLFYEDESAEANEIALFNAIHDEPLPEGTKKIGRAHV